MCQERLRRSDLIPYAIIITLTATVHASRDWTKATCPCGKSFNLTLSEDKSNSGYGRPKICMYGISVVEMKKLEVLNDESYPVVMYSSFSKLAFRKCNLIIHLVHSLPPRLECPGECRIEKSNIESISSSLPSIDIEYHLLMYYQNDSVSLTCSLNFEHIRLAGRITNNTGVISPKDRSILLSAIFWRRLAECQEFFSDDSLKIKSKVYGKRRIHSLLIWVGSRSRKNISKDQQAVLENKPFHGNDGVVGWTVDEDIFPCQVDTTICPFSDKNGNYMHTMPLTQLHDPRCNKEWACAQRRPLRALSHALQLFEPDFVFLTDDDTYVNYDLLQHKLGLFIRNDMQREPIIIGNYLAPRPGQLSPRGFFLGGAGYLIGKAAIGKLLQNEVIDFPPPAPRGPRSARQQASLMSLAREARTVAAGTCPIGCLLPNSNTSRRGVLTIKVSLLEFCTHLMASEYTCHHSDHSMSRCLFYGFNSVQYGYPCDFQATAADLRAGTPFMCGHTIQNCSLLTHLTCHRWKPRSVTDLTPVRTYLTASNSSKWLGCLPE